MGARGKPPAPTELKLVRGERKDRVNTNEPKPAEGEIIPPDWLCIEALDVWREYAPDLQAKKVLTPWDLESFAGWCDAVVRRWRAARCLDEEGEVTEQPVFNRNGDQTGVRRAKNPWMYVWKDANEVVARVGARFGLTPSERSQLRVDPGQAIERSKRRLLS